jgi:hypothetical protein
MIDSVVLFVVGALLLLFGVLFLVMRLRKGKKKAPLWLSFLLVACGVGLLLFQEGFHYRSVEKNIGKRNLVDDWSPKMREELIAQCMENVDESILELHPEIAEEYCSCSADTVMHAMTYEVYRYHSSMPDEEQERIFRPLSEKCQMIAIQMIRDKES